MDNAPISPKELRELYARGVNIMGLFREATGTAENSTDAILASYDLQSGSYIEGALKPERREMVARYTGEIAAVLDPLGATSMLEAGVGEATTLCPVMGTMQHRPASVAGFDISWSRLAYARQYAGTFGLDQIRFFTGDLFHIPVVNDAYDVVYTVHAVEPNHGREREILQELYRVARKWLVLFEPSFELGSDATKSHVEAHGYCRGLPDLAREFGWEIVRHELLQHPLRDTNQTAVLVIRKAASSKTPAPESPFGCPLCRAPLRSVRGQFFCADCSRVFPVLDDIPCLIGANGILASKFQDVTPGASL
jgi:SAM-dependent methyltransferase